MSWLSEYRSSLKSLHAEEFLDIYFFRPLGFLIVKSLYRFPLSPNHYSLMSFLSGMIAAYFFYYGVFLQGAFFFLLFAVFDCCDGMQARMKKNGTEFGRFVDGLVDYAGNSACYISLALGGSKYLPPIIPNIPTSYLIFAAGFSKAFHSIVYDHFLMEYLSYDRGDGGFVQKEIEEIKNKIRLIKLEPKGSRRRLLILWIYLGFSSIQAGNEGRTLKFDSKKYIEKNFITIKLWGAIGPAWHIAMLILAFSFNIPQLFLGYAIVFANLWLLGMFFYQRKINKSLEVEARAT